MISEVVHLEEGYSLEIYPGSSVVIRRNGSWIDVWRVGLINKDVFVCARKALEYYARYRLIEVKQRAEIEAVKDFVSQIIPELTP